MLYHVLIIINNECKSYLYNMYCSNSKQRKMKFFVLMQSLHSNEKRLSLNLTHLLQWNS